jgi:hypothetical protein
LDSLFVISSGILRSAPRYIIFHPSKGNISKFALQLKFTLQMRNLLVNLANDFHCKKQCVFQQGEHAQT